MAVTLAPTTGPDVESLTILMNAPSGCPGNVVRQVLLDSWPDVEMVVD
jgi:hypothetical protein